MTWALQSPELLTVPVFFTLSSSRGELALKYHLQTQQSVMLAFFLMLFLMIIELLLGAGSLKVSSVF